MMRSVDDEKMTRNEMEGILGSESFSRDFDRTEVVLELEQGCLYIIILGSPEEFPWIL